MTAVTRAGPLSRRSALSRWPLGHGCQQAGTTSEGKTIGKTLFPQISRPEPGPAWVSGFVFATDRGMPLDARNLNRSFSASLARLGLPSQRFHDLRHACATLLIEQGVDITVVSRILGHANLATTADVYAHLTRGMQQGAADQMDAILTRSASA